MKTRTQTCDNAEDLGRNISDEVVHLGLSDKVLISITTVHVGNLFITTFTYDEREVLPW